MNIKKIAPLVSVTWLYKNLDNPSLVVLDATMKKVASKSEEASAKKQIKNARFIDIKTVFSDVTAQFPNTMSSEEKFTIAAQELGINNDSVIVVYDDLGIYSSARVWWMFKAMNHQNIAVLDGGLPTWKNAGYPVENVIKHEVKKGNFVATYNSNYFCDSKTVLNSISDENTVVLDARSEDRFYAHVAEPRQGLRSGHIPNSVSLPYSVLLSDGKMKSKKELAEIIASKVNNKTNIIFSCGSGITACILALGTEIIGIKNKKVYDGSWTEWGSLTELPIEKCKN